MTSFDLKFTYVKHWVLFSWDIRLANEGFLPFYSENAFLKNGELKGS